MAYQLLIDPAKRQQYDRRHQVSRLRCYSPMPSCIALCCHVFVASPAQPVAQSGFDWGDFVDGIASGGAKQRKQDNGEPFYGFTDFLRDLDSDLKRWSDQVDKKGMARPAPAKLRRRLVSAWCTAASWGGRQHVKHQELARKSERYQLNWVSAWQDSRACLTSCMMRVCWQSVR